MKNNLVKLNDYEWIIPKSARAGMNVDAKLISSKAMMEAIEDQAVMQLTNVAMLPGVVSPVVAMPDAHWGYGLPVGAVGAFDIEKGVISSGMTGFDINCGINSLSSNLTAEQIQPKMRELITTLFKKVPCGVGSKSKIKLTDSQLDDVMMYGSNWAAENGYGNKDDVKNTEEKGCMEDVNAKLPSDMARKRGIPQLGTLGAGNHFLEVQRVDQIFDAKTAKAYGLKDNTVVTMIHCGSRGFGHQIASDYLEIHNKAVKEYNITLPDTQLVCAPVSSKEGQDYFSAMKCAVNYAFANRQIIAHWVRESFQEVFNLDEDELGMKQIYGLAHNICKIEKHTVDGEKRDLYVHRKGSTRSFPKTPVLIAGSMGTASYILQGTNDAMKKSFGSTCHGAGRALSRSAAIKKFKGNDIRDTLAAKGIMARATNPSVLAEEAPGAYKDIEGVIESVQGAGISSKVARVVPLGVVKG